MTVRKRNKADLHCEQLDSRLVPCVMPGVTPAVYAAMQEEVQHVLDLVPNSAVTDTAIASGNWSNSAIWSAGHAPSAQDNVLINSGVKVMVDNTAAKANTMRVDGVLSFSQTADSLLTVDTIVINAAGDFEMVSPSPAIHTGLTFSDAGPINRVWDPYGLSRQLIAVGNMLPDGTMVDSAKVTILGAQKDGWLSVTGVRAGTSALSLSVSPAGWHVGDSLLFNGTGGLNSQDETAIIKSIQGNQITLVAPLQFDHLTPVGQQTTVANLTRNVVIQSANTTSDPQQNGATMFMHTGGGDGDGLGGAVEIEYADFKNLGRTDKSQPINDPVVVNGVLQAGTGTNPRARYAIHFHRDYNFDPGCTIQVVGNVVEGGPGWGYDNHSSNVDFTDNISYGVYGAGFATEAGNEEGSFIHNLAVHETSTAIPGNDENNRENVNDFGFGGNGFWFQGGYGIKVDSNVAAEAPDVGFVYWGRALPQGVFTSKVFNADLADPTLARGATFTDPSQLPVQEFAANTVIASPIGLNIRWIGINNFAHPVQQQINHFTSWGTTFKGVVVGYSGNYDFVNPVFLAATTRTNAVGIKITEGYTPSIVVDNADIEGFATGVELPGKGIDAVHGGYFDNLVNIYITGRDGANHVTTIDGNVTFGQRSRSSGGYDYFLTAPASGNAGSAVGAMSQGYFSPNTIFLNTTDHPNDEIFYAQQAANVDPFTTANFLQYQLDALPASIVGMTNGQMQQLYGFTYFGSSAPSNAGVLAGSNGLLVGSAQPVAPAGWNLKSALQTNQLNGYILTVVDTSAHPWVTFTAPPVNLQPGWNFLPITHNGISFSFMVFADSEPPTWVFAPNQILTADLANPPTSFAVNLLYFDDAIGPNGKPEHYRVNLAALPIQKAADGTHYVHVSFLLRSQDGYRSDRAGNKTLVSFDVTLI